MDPEGSAIIVPEDLRARILELQWRSLADTSRSQYLKTWKQWCEFCAVHRLHQWLPRDNEFDQSLQLIMFAVDCWKKSDDSAPLRFETIRNKLSHIRWCHQLTAGFRPQLAPQHELVLSAIRRISPPSRERGAVSFTMLDAIAAASDFRIAQHRVICGAAVLGFFFCLRGSEYLSSRRKYHRYCIQVADVSVSNNSGQPTNSYDEASSVTIILRASKTDQSGTATRRELLKSHRAPVCPVFAALLLLANARALHLDHHAPLCSISTSEVLSTQTMTKVLRRAAVRCQQDPSKISTHSLRAGGATAMHAASISTDSIRMHGRWQSDAYRRYVREAAASTTRLAERMVSPMSANRPDPSIGAARGQALVRSGR